MLTMIKQEKLSDVYHFCFIPSDGKLLKGFKAEKNNKEVNVLIMPGSQALANGLLNFLLADSETGKSVVKASKIYWQWKKKPAEARKDSITIN